MLKIRGVEIPRLMLGTSPFLGAGQFGPLGAVYYEKFYLQPENIVNLMNDAYDFGIKCIQVLANTTIVRAIKKSGKDFQIVGVVGLEDFHSELEMMNDLNAEIILTHSSVTDRLDENFSECIDKIEEFAIPGVATHRPGTTIPRLGKGIEIVLAPINKLGMFMEPSPELTLRAIQETDKIVIGKKTLAAGRLRPEEALQYVKPYVDGVAIGVASKEELKETFGVAKKIFGNGNVP